mmetsp:Transcript_39173/g.76021  ORF Transcript_39173/g.76021 Transcript_39173/m.76021 type:complete len:237 (-) Transcript_39173:144-854(-)
MKTMVGASFVALTGVNVLQGIYPLLSRRPTLMVSEFDAAKATPESLEKLGRSGLVELWHGLPAGSSLPREGFYKGTILKAGPLHPASRLITHRVFAPSGCDRWLGKTVEASSLNGQQDSPIKGQQQLQQLGYGENTFRVRQAEAVERRGGEQENARPFGIRQALSRVDGRPCICLDYSNPALAAIGQKKKKDNVFPFSGMRDELREVRPGMYIGLGSMTITGGPYNSALFVLERVE